MLVTFCARAAETLYALRLAVYNFIRLIPHMKRTVFFVAVAPLMSAHFFVPHTDDSKLR
jgi:hypothetical protein